MKMKQVWFLSGVIALCLLGTANPADKVNKYVGDNARKCALCHKEQVKAWKTWPMATAWDDLNAEEQKKEECIKCHVTGYGEPGGFVSFEKTPKLINVQCEVCHGPGGDHMKVKITDIEGKMATVTKPTEETCKGCHTKKDNPYYKEFKYEERLKELANHKKKDK